MVTRKRKGPKLAKTENVQVRLDPRLKWSAEIAARVHRQPLSTFLEWCVVRSLPAVTTPQGQPVPEVVALAWDTEPADRLMRLAMKYPDLLTYPESQIWKYVKETLDFWHSSGKVGGKAGLDLTLVRACWPLLEGVPSGVLPGREDIDAAMLKAQAGSRVTLYPEPGAEFRVQISQH